MDIICKHCNATYTIPDHKLPAKKVRPNVNAAAIASSSRPRPPAFYQNLLPYPLPRSPGKPPLSRGMTGI